MSAQARRPCRQKVMEIAELEAWRHGITLASVTGATNCRKPSAARKRAWLTILAETGCSMNGLASVWGCDRQSIRRAWLAEAARPAA